MKSVDVITLTPAGLADPSLAIAGCRAGALGVLDLEYCPDLGNALQAVARLEQFTAADYGVKVGPESSEVLVQLFATPGRLQAVVLGGGPHADLERWISLLRDREIRPLVEVVCVGEAHTGLALGADGLVLKGNESGGRVGADTAFILLQRWLAERPAAAQRLPVWVQGGIGLHTAAACMAAGAAGVVLDAQLLLAREARLPQAARMRLTAFDGSETVTAGEQLGEAYRFFARPGLAVVEELRREEERLARSVPDAAAGRLQWRKAVWARVAAGPERGLWPLGQDAALARPLAERFRTVGGIVRGVCQSVRHLLAAARAHQPLAEGAPLAQSHGTRYPIVQGPMTRVSDTAVFAEAVAGAGALPFLALALLRREGAEQLLQQTQARLGPRPWGAGILGFAPPEIRREQTEAIRAVRPPFALIAGGRPDQARELEGDGIPTYLHVPSPGLLRMFLRDGARRFIFEGRECGGHVGPRSSFVLWEGMIEALLEHMGPSGSAEGLHILFAGGIHDARSAAMVSALSAGLAERGAAVGVLLGTAYLFTTEAVACGAIVPRYQQEVLQCRDTVLLETGPGHAIRCIPTPYVETFEQEKHRLHEAGRALDDVRQALEALNVGRLRIASKGLDRPEGRPGLVPIEEEQQHRRGMYMIGQAATLRDRVVSMAALHEDVCQGSVRILEELAPAVEPPPAQQPSDVAVIGMACFLPGADSLRAFWENVLGKVDAITEVPADHWDWRLYYDPDPKAPDKISSRWGGFLADMPFDPLAFGMPPNSLHSIEPVQLYVLEAVRRALADAGYAERPFDRERTAVVLGAGGGAAQLATAYCLRSYLPMLATVPSLAEQAADIVRQAEPLLPQWTEDSFPGILVNVIAGRVANRFNFGGPNFAVDAACGSSLAALYAAVRELETRSSDLAVVVGADTVQNPYTYLAFSKTHAFSPRGRCSTFDESADGIVISEGVAVVVLKRLADAERDGDRIYAVVKGVGASSDGRDKGLTAPRPEGQLRALRRAYAKAGLSPARVGFIEAHGTGTVVGDQAEVQALARVFREAQAGPQACVVGSVKSMIGHTKCAAGLAGLVNAALALYHKVLPPLRVERPNSKICFEESPFALNTQPRPWVQGSGQPRCAGVSAFGFGGTNFHAVLQEYAGDYLPPCEAPYQRWPAELCVWRRPTREALAAAIRECHDALARGAQPPLAALACSLWRSCPGEPGLPTLAVVAGSLDDLRDKLALALGQLDAGQEHFHDPRGIFFAQRPARPGGEASAKVTFLFPGQGSQYPDMLAQLAVAFREVRAAFDEAERVLGDVLDRPLSEFVFPPSAFTPQEHGRARAALARTDVAQPALGAAAVGMCRLLERLGLEPDLLAGHSYGDYAALWAAGVVSTADLIVLSNRRGQVIRETADDMPGAMAALEAGPDRLRQLLVATPQVTAANFNGPQQTVVSGTVDDVRTFLERARQEGIRGQPLAVSCGFHSPLVEKAREPFARILGECRFQAPRRPVFANTTAAPYPEDPATIADLLARHLISPVRFHEEVEALYAAGARIFIEAGPQGVLTGLVGQILGSRPHLAVAADVKARPGLVQLQHLLGQLLTAGLPVRLDRLFEGRDAPVLALARLEDAGKVSLPASTWLVNSVRARPLHGPEPRLLGQWAPEQAGAAALAGASGFSAGAGELQQAGAALPKAEVKRPHAEARPAPVANGAAHPEPTGFPAAADEAGQVMLRFQDLMARFLETQRSVMLGYLQAADAPGVVLPSAPEPPVAQAPPAPPKNGHPVAREAPPPPPAREAHPARPSNAAPTAAPADDREALTRRLLAIVCQRTGYPPEMLGLDLDLEADLGIDSIKRVEILGSLAEAGPNGGPGVSVEMEALTGVKTLRGIIDSLVGPRRGAKGHPASGSSRRAPEPLPPPAPPRDGIQRQLVTVSPVPSADGPPALPRGGVVLLTDDGRGIARCLAGLLRARGQPAALLCPRSAGPANGDDTVFHTDRADPRQVADLLGRVRERWGAIAGLIHLLPLAAAPAGEPWQERLNREVKSLFLLARGLADDLCAAASSGPTFLLGVTGMGGAFGADGLLSDSFFPGQGGVAGLVKSLAHEWPDVLVRALDLEMDLAPAEAARCLLAELGDADGPVEIGYRAGRRWTLECRAAPLDTAAAPALALGPQSTILLTGGARGITAAVALELACRYQPTLVLVGRSALPDDAEPGDTAALTEAADLKAALVARARREGRPATAAVVEAAYQRLLHDREIRGNLARLRQAGARVHYYAADVRDEAALAGVLAEVYRRSGRLDGVIHGAGVIQDKLIRGKTPESFDRVFGTKVHSAHILARHLRFEELQLCAFFTSVAGRFGNRGQADYAAANEVLSKLARDLDRRGPCRVVSVIWGPWAGIGMVSELEQHLGRRGLQMIPADVGPRLFDEELRFGKKGECEVVIAGDVGQLARPARTRSDCEGVAP
jgi:acyl transferase domain-containing protein/NAD(P)H-dependent flavin oxidoreductase YrpB (nitropropane dioxygenase family)/NAD(P)-dependent dehydrogenase (short-subunit alcohol dehydrogenase family)